MKKSYICPFCHHKQTSVIEWETQSVAYELDFENNQVEEKDKVGGDLESFACPECGRDLPPKTCKKIEKISGW